MGLWLLITLFLLISIIISWVSFFRTRANLKKITALKKKIEKLTSRLDAIESHTPNEVQSSVTAEQEEAASKDISIETISIETISAESGISDDKPHSDPLPTRKSTTQIQRPRQKIGFEQQFGTRLPVWIGGIALALAGFFLVKYSIDNNLLNPTMRVLLGGFLGSGLLYSAKWLRNHKPDLSNGMRITQSLTGAGISVLYVSLFAATNLYHLLPNFLGFVGMGIVTVVAIVSSLRFGAPIALLGLMGGFLTPALMGSSSPSAPLLFLYLYFIVSGLMVVSKRQNWWFLSIPTIIAAFIWVIIWVGGNHFMPSDSLWLGLFLLGVSITTIINTQQSYEAEQADLSDAFKLTSALNYLTLAGSILFMGIISSKSGFGLMDWSLFGLLSAGGIALAYFNTRLYGFVPWLTMAVNAVMLFVWDYNSFYGFALTLAIFASMYSAAGYLILWRARRPALWAGLSCITALGYYLLAYFKLNHDVNFDVIPFFWGGLSLGLSALTIYVLYTLRNQANHTYYEYLLAIFTSTAAAFLTIGLTIELERDFLSVAIACEILAISLISTRISIKALRPICMALTAVFGFLLLPQIMLLIQLTSFSLLEVQMMAQKGVPIVQWPIFQLGLPAFMFIASAFLLRDEKDGPFIRLLEIAAIAMTTVMGYYLTRHAFHADSEVLFVKAGFFERGITTNILFIYGLLCLAAGRIFNRDAISWSGMTLSGIAMFRILFFDVLKYNPLWAEQDIQGWFIFNTMLIPFALPTLWAWLVSKELTHLNKQKLAGCTQGFILIDLFVLLSLNIRYFFQSDDMNYGVASNAEVYSYSVAWLLFGIGLLLLGILKNYRNMRYASLGMMILTVGKVFLYDAAELEDLYRVFSFFGLGLSLLGLSWFYAHFVFKEPESFHHSK